MTRSVTTQIVGAQVAVALAVAGVAAGAGWTLPLAAVLAVVAVGRLRGRWVYQWIADGSRYLGRRRLLPIGGDLLEFVRPGATLRSIDVDAASVGVVEDVHGLSAIIEVGDTSGLLGEAPAPVPALTELVQPGVRVQVLLAAVAAAGAGASATSYRQLTDGRVLAQHRVFVAVHVPYAGGAGDTALATAVRRVLRRLAPLPGRPLAAASVLRVIGELAHQDATRPARETWNVLELGGLRQASFRLRRWPDAAGALLPRLLTLPCSGTTVSVTAEHRPADVAAEFAVRLAAPSPAALRNAVEAMLRLLEGAGATVQRLDGAHLDGLSATLPLGGAATRPDAMLVGLLAGRDALAVAGAPPASVSPGALAAIEPPIGGEGLVLGVNRKGEPVVVRLFRPEPTRAVLIGGLRCTQTLVLRALAIGAQVLVQSSRPHAWEPFLRGLAGDDQVTLVPPGQSAEPPPATPSQPQLLVVDVGPIGATGLTVVEAAWRATLLVRDELTPGDLDALARADVALLQPLDPHEAKLAEAALGLGDSAGWFTRIRSDMLGVVIGRRTLRWALLSSTPIEQQLIGTASR